MKTHIRNLNNDDKSCMDYERTRIIQDTTKANYVYVVRDKRYRDGIALCSREYMLNELKNSTWRVQLMETDGTLNPYSRVFYEGSDSEEVLRKLEPNWGVWSVKEITDDDDEAVNFIQTVFGKDEPRQYIISLNSIL